MYKDRREWVRQQLMQKPFVSYDELFSQFPGVSQMTLRRDIDYLEKTGQAIKVRGGARSARFLSDTVDDPYFSRMSENVDSKKRLLQSPHAFWRLDGLFSLIPDPPCNR